MKKILFIALAGTLTQTAIAQKTSQDFTHDSLLGRWVIDINVLGGMANQNFSTANTLMNNLNAVNANVSSLKFRDGYSYGADAQLGFFFGPKRHWGIGTGLMFMKERGHAAMENYSIAYQATDGAGNIYRQQVTGHDIKEDMIATNFNVPVVLKYKNRFSKHWGFTADAGALINLEMKNSYTTHANFDYEAIYKFERVEGVLTSVYDNATTPSVNDWLITKAEFLRNNPNGDYQAYANIKRSLGYSVGEAMPPTSKTGSTSYKQASIGLLLQPSFNYFLSDKMALNFGLYYMVKPFSNNAQSDYRLTSGIGSYNSLMSNVKTSTNQDYGINIGLRIFMGRKCVPITISAIDAKSPTYCGLLDGSISIHGLTPNQTATVDYNFNGKQPTQFGGIVKADSVITIDNLGAGTYSDILVTIKKKNVKGGSISLTDPRMYIVSQSTVNPSSTGVCDGSVVFSGLRAGNIINVNKKFNGTDQTVYTGTVGSDKSITISGLCEGKYSGVIANTNNCFANGNDFTLVAPVPVVAVIPEHKPVVIDVIQPVQFDFDRSIIHASDYNTLDEVYSKAMADDKIIVKIDGYTCSIGTVNYNQRLSEKRANAVKRYLVNKGLNESRIRTYGHGEYEPVSTNSTKDGRKHNRRSGLKITLTRE